MMNRIRKTGGITAGVSLVAFGVVFAARRFNPDLDVRTIISFWPVIFILLGIEILVSYFVSDGEKYRYDFVSVILIFAMLLFAVLMAGAELIFEYGCI